MSKLKLLFVYVLFSIVTCYLSGSDLSYTEVDEFNLKFKQSTASEELLPLDILMHSDQGDWIGQGETYHFESELKPFLLRRSLGVENVLSIFLEIDEGEWIFEFAGPPGMPLEVGDYLGADRFPFQSEGQPGMAVSGPGRGCNNISGSFRILELGYDENGAVNCLALDFLQFCDCDSSALTGSIRFNSNIQHSLKEEKYQELLPLDILMHSAEGDWIGQGETYHFESELKPFPLTRSFDVQNGLSISLKVNRDRWRFEFAGPPGMPLGVGDYLGADRFPFQSEGQPGMAVSGPGRGCNNISGSFRILELGYDENGSVNCLALDFLQFCDCDSSALTGSIRFNSNLSHSLDEEIISYFRE